MKKPISIALTLSLALGMCTTMALPSLASNAPENKFDRNPGIVFEGSRHYDRHHERDDKFDRDGHRDDKHHDRDDKFDRDGHRDDKHHDRDDSFDRDDHKDDKEQGGKHPTSHHGPHANPVYATVGKYERASKCKNEMKTDFYLIIDEHNASNQINATIPLWVCMYGYGEDGKVVVPTENRYTIRNNSISRVKIDEINAHAENGWRLVPDAHRAKDLKMSINGELITERIGKLHSPWKVEGRSELNLPIQAQIAPGVNEGQRCTNVVRVVYTISYDVPPQGDVAPVHPGR